MTPEIQNELQLIREALAQAPQTVLTQNAVRALEIVSQELKPFGYDECYPMRACVWKRRNEWVLELEGTINDTNMTIRFPQPGHLNPEDVPDLPVRLDDSHLRAMLEIIEQNRHRIGYVKGSTVERAVRAARKSLVGA